MTPPSRKNKRVNREEIARRAGVSPSTVSRALDDNPLIPAATRGRIKKIAAKLGYVPSHLGKSYYQGKSFRLGVVVPFSNRNVVTEYFSKMIYGIITTAEQDHYAITVVADDHLSAGALCRRVQSRSMDGLLFLNSRRDDRRFGGLYRKGIPFIMVHHYVGNRPFLFMECDPGPGMIEAFEHLKVKGVRSTAFLAGNRLYVDALDRLALYRRLVRRFGFKDIGVIPGDFSRSSGVRAAAHLVKKGVPDAVLCANDRMAFGLLEGLRGKGVRVPEQVRVIGFDNQSVCTLISPQLTTIDNPFEEIGKQAAKKLIDLIRGKKVKSGRLPSKLILRESA